MADAENHIITQLLLYWNLLHVQNSIGNWRRKQDDVPIDIQPQPMLGWNSMASPLFTFQRKDLKLL